MKEERNIFRPFHAGARYVNVGTIPIPRGRPSQKNQKARYFVWLFLFYRL